MSGAAVLRSRLAGFVSRRPGAVLVGVALLTVAAVCGIVDPRTGAVRLRIDPATDTLISADAKQDYYQGIRERFGNDEILIVAVEHDDLFSPEGLETVDRLTRRLRKLDEVRGVVSLANALRVHADNGSIEIRPFLDEIPTQDAALAALREDAVSSPIYGGKLVSDDGRTTALAVYFRELPEEAFIERRLDMRVAAIAREEIPEGRLWLTGTPHIKAETSAILLRDLGFQTPIILGFMVLFSALATRRLVATLVPISTVLLALVWTLGFIAGIGRALNIITTLIPPLVLIVGFAYVIHVVMALMAAAREHAGQAPGSRLLVREALEHTGFPVALTALTTMVGFGSLALSSVDVVREFGLLATAGVFASTVASLTFAPAVLALARPPRVSADPRWERGVDRVAAGLGRWDVRHRNLILLGGAAVAGLSIVGIPRIVVNTETIGNFRPDAQVRRSYEAIDQRLRGANRFYVVLDTGTRNAVKDPAVLARISDLQRYLESQAEIGATTSLADYVRVFHRAFRGGAPELESIPESQRLVAQLLFFGPRKELARYTDTLYSTAVIHVRTTATSSRDLTALVERIEARLDGLGEGLVGAVTGSALVVTHTLDRISEGQARSLSAAFVLILGILVLYFRSLRIGLVALVPNALPIVFYFGLLGWTGTSLNSATALMGSMILGIAVDDTIHFLVHFRRSAQQLGSDEAAARAALASVGRAVTYTTVVLCLGLVAVANSDLETQASFGALGAITLAFAWLTDVVFTPALCSRMGLATEARTASG